MLLPTTVISKPRGEWLEILILLFDIYGDYVAGKLGHGFKRTALDCMNAIK